MKTLFCLMGPTACGKTDLAIQLCERLPLEIISVDSAMVYKGMDIGTAKPSPDVLKKIPHHLIDILEVNQSYSAADFCNDVEIIAEDIFHRGKIPFLVGGTMLYFKALQQGLSVLPSANAEIRKQILKEAQSVGWEALHDQLQTIDPKAAARIHPNDPQRIERALEVYYLTGKPLSEHFSTKQETTFQYLSVGLFPENRQFLHQRIEMRFKQMMAEGWIDEVHNLIKNEQVDFSSPALRMVGYRQIALYLQGKIDKKSMIEQGIAATRQLAKRQMTWLRHWPTIFLLDPWPSSKDTESVFEKLLALVGCE